MKMNKLADLQDTHQLVRKPLIERLANMYYTLKSTGLDFSDHLQEHWLRMWEYSSAIIESKVDTRMRVLDAGGTGTVFSYYLASEGCNVTTVDIDEKKMKDAVTMSKHLGLNMIHRLESITELSDSDEYFDSVFCICVIEHIPIEQQSVAVKHLSRVLKPGGTLSLTFDYGKYAADYPFKSPSEVIERLVAPSGLKVLGDNFEDFAQDFGTHLKEYTFGSLFLKKEGTLNLPIKRDYFEIRPFPVLDRNLIKHREFNLVNSFYDSLKHNISPETLREILKGMLSVDSYNKISKLDHESLIKIIESSCTTEDILLLFDRLYGRFS